MLHAFTFGDLSSVDYDIYVFADHIDDSPKRDVETVKVPGRNGLLTFDNGRYENVSISYDCIIMGHYNNTFSAFRSHLLSLLGYQRLEDTFNPAHFRYGFFDSVISPQTVPNFADGKFKITFNCKPQRFLKYGENEVEFTADGTIENPFMYDALPLLRVVGYGTIGIGSSTITIAQHDQEYIDIDCDLQDASVNSVVSVPASGFPKLHAGLNGITLPETVTSLTITPRWWSL